MSTKAQAGSQRGWRAPVQVFAACACAAFFLGLSLGLVSGSDELFAPVYAFLLLAVVVLALAAAAAVVAVRAIEREDFDVDIVLYLVPSAIMGATLFMPILCLYVIGLFVPFAIGLEEWSEQDAEIHWPGFMLILLLFAGITSVVVGGPVGVIAWASRFAGRRRA